jgi:hypothetical protein
MIVEKRKALGHPHIEAAVGVFGDLANDVNAIAQPLQFAARRHRKDRDFAIFALISVLHTASFNENGPTLSSEAASVFRTFRSCSEFTV